MGSASPMVLKRERTRCCVEVNRASIKLVRWSGFLSVADRAFPVGDAASPDLVSCPFWAFWCSEWALSSLACKRGELALASRPRSRGHIEISSRPELTLYKPLRLASLYIYGDQISWHCDFVESNAANSRNFGVHSGVVVTEEADAWLNSCEKHIQARCFADVTGTPAMPLETYTGWSIMCQQDVHVARARKPFNLVGRVVSLGVTLELIRGPLVVRRTIATANAAYPNGAPSD